MSAKLAKSIIRIGIMFWLSPSSSNPAIIIRKLETKAEIRVPLFINIGDKVRVDTRTGDYKERLK